jgi:hypothetical protein
MKQFFFRPSIVNVITYILFVMAIVIAVFAYKIVSPENPLTIGKVIIITPETTSGSSMKYQFSYCQTTKTTPIVYRQLVPSDPNNIVTIPATLGVIRQGCHTNTIILQVPVGVTPGDYQLKGTIVYPLNSFRSFNTQYVSANTVHIK